MDALKNESSYRLGRGLGILIAMGGLCGAAGGAEPTVTRPGKEFFVKDCAVCHSEDGTAQTPAAKNLGVKNLSQSRLTEAQITRQILEGRQEDQKTSKMPAFKEKLSRSEIESLVAVVKEFRTVKQASGPAPETK